MNAYYSRPCFLLPFYTREMNVAIIIHPPTILYGMRIVSLVDEQTVLYQEDLRDKIKR